MEFFVIHTGFILDFIGKLLVSYTAISVHHRVWQEHKIDEKVFKEMSRERKLAMVGFSLMFIGFFIELYVRSYLL